MKQLKEIVRSKFHPILQHDIHEFLTYILSSAQDETTPEKGSTFNGSDMKKDYQQVINEYYESHPSIIDKLFTGISLFLFIFRNAENYSSMWEMLTTINNI